MDCSRAAMVFSAVLVMLFAATMTSAADLERQHAPTTTGNLRNRASQYRRQGASHGAKHVAGASNGHTLGAGNGHAGRSLSQSASSTRCRKLLQPLATATDGDEHHPLTAPLAEAPEQQYQATEQQAQVLQQFPGLYVGGGEHSNLSMDSLASKYGNASQSVGNAANITVGNSNSNSSSSLISISSMEGAEDDDKLGHGFPEVYLQQHPGQLLPRPELNPGHLNVTAGTNTTITNTTADGAAPATGHASNDSQTHQVLQGRFSRLLTTSDRLTP